ncbi:MAG: MurR/RpiR family transcriptional regulator [candidate division KSB1 bacterium]|nr:MurR/RpiR family transcriptional regulator [candidate division KSB1 bacterium]
MKSKNIQSGALLRIESMRDSLKSAEQRLSDFILSNPKDMVHMTIQELEAQSGSSYATIIRFCKKIGYTGFKELKQSLVQDIIINNESAKVSSLLPIEQDDSTESIIKKTFQHSLQTLDNTQSIIDETAINRAATALSSAQETLFIGTGTSGVSAAYAFARFYRIGKRMYIRE